MAGRGKGNSKGFSMQSFKDEFESSDLNYQDNANPQSRQHSHGREDNVKLHVTNIPQGLDENGLKNLFAAECGVPDHVYISKNKKSPHSNSYWGFVEYKTAAEAQSAIYAVHRKPPYDLNVQFSKSYQEGNRDRVSRDKSPSGFGGQSRGRGQSRGQSPLIKGQPNNSFRGPHSNDGSFTEDFAEDSNPQRFSSHNSHAEHNPGSPREKLPGLPIEKYSHVEISDEMDLHVAAYLSSRAKDLTLEDHSALCSEIKLALPFKPGQCSYCHRTAIYTCSRCKSWYCSDFCRSTHWPQHKDNCFPRSVIFQKDGAITYKDVPDAFCNDDSLKQKNSRSPRGNQRSYGPDHRNDYVNHQNGSESYSRFEDKFRDSNDKARNADVNKGGFDNSRGSDYGARNNQRNNQPRRGGAKGGARNDKPNWGKSVEDDFNKSQKNKLSNLDRAPITQDGFTEVTIGAVGNGGEFWAYKVEDYKKQGVMMNALNELANQDRSSADLKFEIGAKCIAPYQGDWYRAEIIKTFRDNVKVVFIDFGNESEVRKKEVRPLPDDLLAESPMAHKYVLAESAGNPKLIEEFTFRIKPVSQDNDGRWIVHAEGVQYRDLNGFEGY